MVIGVIEGVEERIDPRLQMYNLIDLRDETEFSLMFLQKVKVKITVFCVLTQLATLQWENAIINKCVLNVYCELDF